MNCSFANPVVCLPGHDAHVACHAHKHGLDQAPSTNDTPKHAHMSVLGMFWADTTPELDHVPYDAPSKACLITCAHMSGNQPKSACLDSQQSPAVGTRPVYYSPKYCCRSCMLVQWLQLAKYSLCPWAHTQALLAS